MSVFCICSFTIAKFFHTFGMRACVHMSVGLNLCINHVKFFNTIFCLLKPFKRIQGNRLRSFSFKINFFTHLFEPNFPIFYKFLLSLSRFFGSCVFGLFFLSQEIDTCSRKKKWIGVDVEVCFRFVVCSILLSLDILSYFIITNTCRIFDVHGENATKPMCVLAGHVSIYNLFKMDKDETARVVMFNRMSFQIFFRCEIPSFLMMSEVWNFHIKYIYICIKLDTMKTPWN